MIDILVMIYHYFRASSENLLKNKTLYGIMVVMALVLGCKALKGENLLINGDFETGIAPGWEPSFVQGVTVKIDTFVHYSGGSSLKIENFRTENNEFYGCNQRVKDFIRGRWYRVVAAVKASNYSGRIGIAVHYFDAHGRKLPIKNADLSINCSDENKDWGIYHLNFYTHREASSILIALYIKGNGTVWFDDVRLSALEENSGDTLKTSDGAYLLHREKATVWFEYAEKKVFRHTHPPQDQKNGIEIFCAKNEWESFQIVIVPQDGFKRCSIKFSDLLAKQNNDVIPKHLFSSYKVGYVKVNQASNTDGVAGLHPDYLKPDSVFDLSRQVNNPIWVNVFIPSHINSGIYTGEVTLVFQDDYSVHIPIKVNVWDFVLPRENHIFIRSNFWLSLIKQYDHRKEAEILKDYYNNLHSHRVNVLRNVSLKTEYIQGKLICHFAEFDEKVEKLFKDYGFDAITVGPFLGDASGWRYRRKWMGVETGSNEFWDLLKEYCRKLESHLKKRGWLEKCWLQYWDEPRLEDVGYDKIIQIAKVIKESAPRLKIFMTTKPFPELRGLIDIWCIPFNRQSFDEAEVHKRQSAGDLIFVYHNDPYIDTPLIDKRLYAWRYWKANVDGAYSWWNLTHWEENPYYNSRMLQSGAGGKKVSLKAGDGVLLYPNPDFSGPPINSLRWEIFRQGLEDYEYFWILTQRIKKVLNRLEDNRFFSDYQHYKPDKLVGNLIKDYLSTWERSISSLYRIRRKIAQEILEVDEHPYIFVKTIPEEGSKVKDHIKIYGLTESGVHIYIEGIKSAVDDHGLFEARVKVPREKILTIVARQGNKKKEIKLEFK
ncbi:MAG TPA: DUF4091 domain-containing protein [candidate division WOR-3 bacterium]|uniref:DUF4091 domain-containing protein n=1 Tax=candidate division WOR-3 bacterium TaxID=2052148 RepID=A0A9C9EL46_UNCW3|nr:DUF4091 domain-containing protein [candidate division WOR-3 bacterium]